LWRLDNGEKNKDLYDSKHFQPGFNQKPLLLKDLIALREASTEKC